MGDKNTLFSVVLMSRHSPLCTWNWRGVGEHPSVSRRRVTVLLSRRVLQELGKIVDGIVPDPNLHGIVRHAVVVFLRHHLVVQLSDFHVSLFFFRGQHRPAVCCALQYRYTRDTNRRTTDGDIYVCVYVCYVRPL